MVSYPLDSTDAPAPARRRKSGPSHTHTKASPGINYTTPVSTTILLRSASYGGHAKHYSTVCVLDADESIVLEATVRPNSPERFEAVFSELDAPVRCVFECGLNWGYLFDLLESLPMVEEIQLANAQRVRIIAEAQIKTDKLVSCRMPAWHLRHTARAEKPAMAGCCTDATSG